MRTTIRRLGRLLGLAAVLAMLSAPVGLVQAALVWQTETVDDDGDVGQYSSLALDSSGQPHISYLDITNTNLKYAVLTGAGWQTETVDGEGDVGFYNSLALDGNGRPHISYFEGASGDLKYATFDGSDWQIDTVDDDGFVGRDSSLALDSAGRPHISYFDFSNSALKYAVLTVAGWQTETVDSIGYVGQFTSLAIDGDGRPHISYFDSTIGILKYAAFDGSTWQIQAVDSVGFIGGASSLALDASGQPRISYFGFTPPTFDSVLKYAVYDGSAWQLNVVAPAASGGVGLPTSALDIDSSGQSHISFYDGGGDGFKYARSTGTAWEIETIEAEALVGLFSSLMLDNQDRPHISYFDGNNGALKYAHLTVNEPPTVEAGGPYNGIEGSLVTLQGASNDPEGDELTTTWSYEVDSADPDTTCTFDDPNQVDTTFSCTGGGAFTLTLTADDGLNPPATDTATATFVAVTNLCASNYTGILRYADPCQDHETTLSIPDLNGPVIICASTHNGLLRSPANGLCAGHETSYVLPEDGPLNVCVSTYTQTLRVVYGLGQCAGHEYGRVIAATEVEAPTPRAR